MALILSIALVSLLTLLYYYYTRTINYWKHKGVPGPVPVPFIGNLTQSVLRRKNIAVVFKDLYDAFPNEKIVGIHRMTNPCLLIRDLDIIKHVMIKDFDVFSDRGTAFSKKGLGANLFHADENTWRVLRNHFTPIFTSGKLKNMLYMITEIGDNFMKHIGDICIEQSEHDVYALAQIYTTASISACAFGLDVNIQNNPDMVRVLKKIDKSIFNVSFARELDMMYPGILQKFNLPLFAPFVSEFFNNLVQDVVKQRNGTPSNRNDFMDLILELRQQKELYGKKRSVDDKQLSLELTDDVIAAQAFVFYGAGYETSATTIAFLLYELAKNPDIQETLIAEIDQVLEKHEGNVTYKALQDMSYLDKVLNETLRFYPLVEPLQRKAQFDYKVPGTHLTIPKGTYVLVSAYGIQHDKKYYSDPEKFDPERHDFENSKDRHPCAYIPFGVGPRNCIGMRFAIVQARVFAVKFFTNFRVQKSQNTPAEAQICPRRVIIGPKNGIHLNIIRR